MQSNSNLTLEQQSAILMTSNNRQYLKHVQNAPAGAFARNACDTTFEECAFPNTSYTYQGDISGIIGASQSSLGHLPYVPKTMCNTASYDEYMMSLAAMHHQQQQQQQQQYFAMQNYFNTHAPPNAYSPQSPYMTNPNNAFYGGVPPPLPHALFQNAYAHHAAYQGRDPAAGNGAFAAGNTVSTNGLLRANAFAHGAPFVQTPDFTAAYSRNFGSTLSGSATPVVPPHTINTDATHYAATISSMTPSHLFTSAVTPHSSQNQQQQQQNATRTGFLPAARKKNESGTTLCDLPLAFPGNGGAAKHSSISNNNGGNPARDCAIESTFSSSNSPFTNGLQMVPGDNARASLAMKAESAFAKKGAAPNTDAAQQSSAKKGASAAQNAVGQSHALKTKKPSHKKKSDTSNDKKNVNNNNNNNSKKKDSCNTAEEDSVDEKESGQQQQQQQPHRLENSKNILRAYQRAIYHYMEANKEQCEEILGFPFCSIVKQRRQLMGNIQSIREMRSMWTGDGVSKQPKDVKIARLIRIMSLRFLRRECSTYFTQNKSKISNIMKYRALLIKFLAEPDNFIALKLVD